MLQNPAAQQINRHERGAFANRLAVAVKLLFHHFNAVRMRQTDINRTNGIIGRRVGASFACRG